MKLFHVTPLGGIDGYGFHRRPGSWRRIWVRWKLGPREYRLTWVPTSADPTGVTWWESRRQPETLGVILRLGGVRYQSWGREAYRRWAANGFAPPPVALVGEWSTPTPKA